MTYQPYPTTAGNRAVASQPSRPWTIVNAVRLMYVGAGLDLLRFVVLPLATISSLHTAIVKAYPHDTAAQVHSLETGSLVQNVLLGVVAAALWIWMARANGAGRRFARNVASALFGIFTAEVLLIATTLSREKTISLPIILVVGSLLVWLVGLAATYLLWRQQSKDYYAAVDQV